MSNNKQTSVDWIFNQLSTENLLGLFTWDQMQRVLQILEQAKAMHNKEHGITWDDSMDNFNERGMNQARAWDDFDEYYKQKYGGNK